MTRKERLLTQAHKERSVSEELAFQRGAEWADNNPNWVSVEEGLPEEQTTVIARHDWGEFFIGDYYPENNTLVKSNGRVTTYVTHWMPLPQPPKGE